jgi:hypothetical protein
MQGFGAYLVLAHLPTSQASDIAQQLRRIRTLLLLWYEYEQLSGQPLMGFLHIQVRLVEAFQETLDLLRLLHAADSRQLHVDGSSSLNPGVLLPHSNRLG